MSVKVSLPFPEPTPARIGVVVIGRNEGERLRRCLGLLLAADLLWAIARCSLLLRRGLGLGGRNGQARKPRKVFLDLIARDLRALIKSEWFRLCAGSQRGLAPPQTP